MLLLTRGKRSDVGSLKLAKRVAPEQQVTDRNCAIHCALMGAAGEGKMLGLGVIILFLFLAGTRIVSELKG
jgi:hypothetical protein